MPNPRFINTAALLAVLAATPCVHASLPAHNPVADFYGAEAYPWTDDLPWHNVVDFTSFNGADNHARFEAAQDAVEAMGGGVIYFPPGTYEFTDHLHLRDGVILRGAQPAQTDAKELDFDPPSKLVFPKYHFVAEGNGTPNNTAFKFIRVAPDHLGSHMGAVWLDINRAGINVTGGEPEARRNLVFGVRNNNVAEASDQVPIEDMHGWQRHSWRFTRNIGAYAYRYLLVANNRVNDKHWLQHRRIDGRDTFGVDLDDPAWEVDDFEQPGYLIREQNNQWADPKRELEGHQAVFSYTDHYGIVVRGSGGGLWGVPPNENPTVFRRDKTIRDNWVYATMRVKMHTSGYGLVIRDNILRDREGKQHWFHPTGQRLVNPANTLENRGIDWSGRHVVIEGNDVEVHRHQMRETHYRSVDGEAILYQECCGGSIIDGITIRNNIVNAYIGLYKGPYLRNALIEGNTVVRGPTADSGLGIYVDADTNNHLNPVYNVIVRNNTLDGLPIRVRGNLRPDGEHTSIVHDNVIDGASINIMDYVAAENNTRSNGDPVTATLHQAVYDIPWAPELDVRISTHPDDTRGGEAVRLVASVVNDVPVDRVVFYDGTTEIAEFTEPPFTDLEWIGAASSDDPLYSAVAYQPPVSVDRDFVQYTSEFPTAWTGEDPDQAYSAWLEGHFTPAERDDPGLLFQDFNGNGQPALLDFLVGRDPKQSHPPVVPEIVHGDDDSIRARFRFRPAPQVAAVLETSNDLSTWTPLLQSGDWTVEADGDEWILEAEVASAGDPAIIRVRATAR
ncbi:MAG: hypothetical protein JJU00_19855 [Opitutales bacterium]|nr:hypothetical protein [Opitutales bacterium]